jgi:iron(III) transport system substrate-binding protein
MWVGFCAIALAATAASTVRAQTANQPTFAQLLAGAKKESGLVVWASTPNQEKTHRALGEAFNKRFGLTAKLDWLVLHPSRSVGRVVAEAAAGRVNVDVSMAQLQDVPILRERNLLKPFPWVDVFKMDLPTIGEPAGRVGPEAANTMMTLFDNAYGLAWNTKLANANELPSKFTDLDDPKWRGRLVITSLGTPFEILSLDLGTEKPVELVKKMVDNRPILKSSTPAVSSAITAGEGHFGVSSYFNAERAKAAGEPQEFRFFDDYIPIVSIYIYVPEGSPNPNTARLFAAWVVTEGARIIEDMESASRTSDPVAKLGRAITNSRSKLLQEASLADAAKLKGVSETLVKIYTGK